MTSVDAFYTPLWLADELTNSVSFPGAPKIIADLAVGDGALLQSARLRWSDALFLANDISTLKCDELNMQHPTWVVSNFDFLVNKSAFVDSASKHICISCGIDLILLNPPFSCRGSKRILIEYAGDVLLCSVALSFVINSLSLLSKDGECICILPNSCLSSEKDAVALELIKKDFDVLPLKKICSKTFENCSASTTVVKITRKKATATDGDVERVSSISSRKKPSKKIEATLFRGKIKVDKWLVLSSEKHIPFIHTTDINNGITFSKYLDDSIAFKTVCGPAILIPRVGSPLISKFILNKSEQPIVISDCIIAIKFKNLQAAVSAYSRVMRNWSLLRGAYDGTCAQYTTLKKIKFFLDRIDITAEIER